MKVSADWGYVGRQLYLGTKNLVQSPILSLKSYGLGLGLGMMALPKTLYYPIRSIYR